MAAIPHPVRPDRRFYTVLILLQAVFKVLVLGPMGTTALLIWNRDEEVMSKEVGEEGDVIEIKQEE